ncbi:hypothetical protein PGT21_004716 [Puccinia graminis f. sp. tritici]|uniref:Protein CPL1-like domain-containing protein n=1 Tax=Puccinia graminis f. sp. tritici TaxID=56615 RepID=A0A5B0MQQ3_PUCGR|nr:hypothetical protein PGT21_005241 [Puccinia graminis f. sp. tritici]KAA1082288.1 hypothetical protein PGTUg99_031525 [Puccinia graminis f. sp. tritici]KAA1082479.1 hypothetical protein PGT21_004716 [Puccinia graminis f. sp. tritici]KAA1133628.1 hypothetical protein PGTUg99_028459 [Puccinia graminis f. sp. tritici]
MFARLSLLVLLLTASLSAASPSSTQGTPTTPLLKRTTRTALAKKSNNSTPVARSLPLLPILGQILPVSANLKVDICLDLSVKVLGIATVNVFATAALAASITSKGISVDELAVVQASLAAELADVARVSTTAWACEQACTSDICSSHAFDRVSRTCTLAPKQLTTRSNILARLIAQLGLLGRSSPRYCQLCSHRCSAANSAPSAAARQRKRHISTVGHCPTGYDACPFSAFSTSQGYECVITQDELEHCGGCSTTGEGVDCTTVVGIKNPGCSRGQCIAFECEEGYYLSPEKTCLRRI